MSVRLLHFEQYQNEAHIGEACQLSGGKRKLKLESSSLIKCITMIMFNSETRLALSDIRTKINFSSSTDDEEWSKLKMDKCTLGRVDQNLWN